MDSVIFAPGGAIAEAAANEAVFGSRNPNLLIRSERHLIGFSFGEYRTSDPDEIRLLLGVVKDEARGNRGVWLRSLPTVQSAAVQERPAEPELTAVRDEVGVPAPAPNPRHRGPDRVPRRRNARKRGG